MLEWEDREPHYVFYMRGSKVRSFHANNQGVIQITEEALLTIMEEAGWKHVDSDWLFPDEPTA